MISLNPYIYIAGAVMALALAGALFYMNQRIHYFHTQYDKSLITVALKDQQIKTMTEDQNKQLAVSDKNIQKIVDATKSSDHIVKQIMSAPAKPCAVPTYPKEVTDAF